MTEPRNRDAERRAYELRRACVLAWYGQECACCGTTEDLGVDHVNGDGKAHRLELFGRTTYNPTTFYLWLIEQGFPDDPPLRTYCRPCNSSASDSGEGCRLDHADRQGQRRRDNASHQAAWRARTGKARPVSTRPGTVGGRILAYLAEHGPSQAAVITAALELRPSSAAATLSGLCADGHVHRPAHGIYALPGQEGRELVRVYEPGPEGWAAHGGRGWAAGTTWTTDKPGQSYAYLPERQLSAYSRAYRGETPANVTEREKWQYMRRWRSCGTPTPRARRLGR
jgi:hypothetical protein